MREQIQAYVNGLFADAALTIRNAEVRQEILQHTLDRRRMTKLSPVSATCRSSTSINRQKNKRKHRSPRGIFPPRPLRRMRLRPHLQKRRNSLAGPSR